jgi:raffinose/stachyose/melibiose transport system permease protein
MMPLARRRSSFPVHIAVFLAPAILIYSAFMVIPLINSLRLSFFEISNQNQLSFNGMQLCAVFLAGITQ